jgi:cobalt-zinc-cadmium efflux system outer membrane protein
MRRDRVRVVCVAVAAAAASACVRPQVPDPASVSGTVREKTGAAEASAAAASEWLADGLDQGEAVALALARNPDFQADLAELGVAAAAVSEVAQLRNPALTLLLPWGPKQLEATVRWPIDTLWLRPKRVAAARLDAEAVAQRLVANGLELAAQARMAWADAALAEERGPIVQETVGIRRRIADIAEERMKIGEAGAFETGLARDDRARSLEDAARQKGQEEVARQRLGSLIGLPEGDFRLGRAEGATTCTETLTLVTDARAARPELRAAELTVEAAAKRAGLTRLEALGLTVVADANQKGSQGFEAGPGFDINVPLFHLGGAARQRARAELVRARARLVALTQQVDREVREARTRVMEAQAVLAAWDAVVRERVTTLEAARARFDTGEEPLLVVLESERQLGDAQLRRADVRAELLRAKARLARVVGREPSCTVAPNQQGSGGGR